MVSSRVFNCMLCRVSRFNIAVVLPAGLGHILRSYIHASGPPWTTIQHNRRCVVLFWRPSRGDGGHISEETDTDQESEDLARSEDSANRNYDAVKLVPDCLMWYLARCRFVASPLSVWQRAQIGFLWQPRKALPQNRQEPCLPPGFD